MIDKKNNIGIYKITSPSNRIYIGQSVNIKYRLNKYKRLNCKTQSKLHRSFLKYGVNNHQFEIIKICDIDELNEYERYFQEMYDSVNNGLNCIFQKTDFKKQKMSKETRLKISASTKGKTFSIETKQRISDSLKGRKRLDSHSLNISLSKKGKKGKPHSKETLIKLSENNKNSKIILDLKTGVFYNSTSELANILGIKYSTLNARLSGQNINNTSYVRV
jgi:group I intron endonuclease